MEQAPSSTPVLWNAAICSKLTSDFEAAADYFQRFRDLRPEHFPVWSNLVQVYQAKGDLALRDQARRDLIAYKNVSEDPEIRSLPVYVREWFRTAQHEVFGLEYFELEGDFALRYVFHVNGIDGDLDYKISLGSYKFTNQVERESGRLPEGVRLFHLDAYRNRDHFTLAFYEGEPSYDEIRPVVIKVIESGGPEAFALSRSKLPQ